MEFPSYGLEEVENDIRVQCKLEGGDSLMESIPKLPNEVGGDTDYWRQIFLFTPT